MRKVYSLLVIVAGLTAGCALGVNEGEVWFGGISYLSETFATATYKNYAYAQYRRAEPDQARSALLGYARFTEELNALRPSRALKLDVGLSYARLAGVETAAGNLDQSKAYLAKAQVWLRMAGPSSPEYSEDQIVNIVNRIDRRAVY